MNRLLVPCLLALAAFAPAVRAEEEENPAKEALQSLNDYVGSWKGAGSTANRADNWKEKAAWGWKFKGGDPALVLQFTDGKEFTKGELRYSTDKKKYQLKVADKKGAEQLFEGELKKGYLTLDRLDPKSGETYRLKMNSAGGGIRFVYAFERKAKGSTIFIKQYQVDYSKEGESFAGGGKKKECVVTGGEGTMEVSFQGKTYYVCCSGCRDAFNENPEKILKEFAERKKKEK